MVDERYSNTPASRSGIDRRSGYGVPVDRSGFTPVGASRSGVSRAGVPRAAPRTGNTSSRIAAASIESRRYRIVGVLGKGGFGTVYHARLEGGDGFVKDVAIKLLSEVNPSIETLSRFRDEARILGRLRDRNIVSVDPPTKLDGRWAVVMEYVDGLDCRRLVRQFGGLPPTVVAGIIEEVARTLANLWDHDGEDGQPIRLLHRDLKPSNIQVTPTGAVKLLDFGVARAEFGQRETFTTNHIAGTLGYIPPERLRGIEEPSGDVYSLGIVLEELISGKRPQAPESGGDPAPPQRNGLFDDLLELAHEMRAYDPAHRPTAQEVEYRCAMFAQQHPGPSLREWARENVRKGPTLNVEDPLIGHTLSEETLARHAPDRAPPRGRRALTAVLLAVTALAAVVALVLLVGVLAGGGWYWAQIQANRPIAGNEPIHAVDPAVPAVPSDPAIEAPTTDPGAPPVDADPGQPAPVQPVRAAQPPAQPDRGPRNPPPPRPARAEPTSAPTTGVVEQQGADAIELVGDAGTFGVGMVPAGTYKIVARFGAETVPAGQVTVVGGQRSALRCDPRFKRCMQ